MIYSLLQLVHSPEGNKKRSAPAYTLTSRETLPSFYSESSTMVSDKLFQNTEPSNDLVEYKMCGCLTIRFNCGHILCPFHEIINNHNNVMVPPQLKLGCNP